MSPLPLGPRVNVTGGMRTLRTMLYRVSEGAWDVFKRHDIPRPMSSDAVLTPALRERESNENQSR